MQGKGTEASPFVITSYEDWISYLTEFNFSSTFDKDTPCYYKLGNNIECRKYIWRNEDVLIDVTTTTAGDKMYTKILDCCGYAIKNFFVNQSKLVCTNLNDSTYRIYNGIIDSWVIKDSTFGQGIVHDFGVFHFIECSISMAMVGSNIIHNFKDGQIHGSLRVANYGNHLANGNSNLWHSVFGASDGTITYTIYTYGSSIMFETCAVTLKYYPEVYWNTVPTDWNGIYKNMLRMIQVKNTKMKLYMPRSLKIADAYNATSGNKNLSSAGCCWDSTYGLSITDFSDVEIYLKQMNVDTDCYGGASGYSPTNARFICYFSELSDSAVKFYPDKLCHQNNSSAVQAYITTTAANNAWYKTGGGLIKIRAAGILSGKNCIYVEPNETYAGKLFLGHVESAQSQNVVLTSDYSNIKDDEWLIENRIVCMDTKLNSKTGD